MLPRHADPIAAIATAPGRGAVGIVRVSGRKLAPLVDAICGRALEPREATYLPFRAADGTPIDQGLALHFPAPQSYTGEDVLELQAHGGPVVLQLLLARCLEAAAEVDGLVYREGLNAVGIRGGVAGNVIAPGDSRTLGTIIGAIAGGALGAAAASNANQSAYCR